MASGEATAELFDVMWRVTQSTGLRLPGSPQSEDEIAAGRALAHNRDLDLLSRAALAAIVRLSLRKLPADLPEVRGPDDFGPYAKAGKERLVDTLGKMGVILKPPDYPGDRHRIIAVRQIILSESSPLLCGVIGKHGFATGSDEQYRTKIAFPALLRAATTPEMAAKEAAAALQTGWRDEGVRMVIGSEALGGYLSAMAPASQAALEEVQASAANAGLDLSPGNAGLDAAPPPIGWVDSLSSV
jgi:hypothetical protein